MTPFDGWRKISGMIEAGPPLNIQGGTDAKRKGIQAAQWNATLEGCPLCCHLDGKVISVEHPDFDRFKPPLHSECNCFWIYIGTGQAHVEYTWKTPSDDLLKRHAPHLISR